MKIRAIAMPTIVMLAAAIWLFGTPDSRGQGGYTWRLGSGPNGEFTASIFSVNTLSIGSSRVIDYHPTLTIACRPGGEWSQTLHLKDAVSGNGAVNVSVRLDNGGERTEQWALGFQNRSFSRNGSGDVARLLQARRLRLSWRFGLLAGRGEAVFNLSGVREAVAGLAGACGSKLPLS